MYIAALIIFVLALLVFSVKAVLIGVIMLLGFAGLCLTAQRRWRQRSEALDIALGFTAPPEPERIITGDHPLRAFGRVPR
jgi:hypothetical protein